MRETGRPVDIGQSYLLGCPVLHRSAGALAFTGSTEQGRLLS